VSETPTGMEQRRAIALRLVALLCEEWMLTSEEIAAALGEAASVSECGHREAEHTAFSQGAALAGAVGPPAWLSDEASTRAWKAGAGERTAAIAWLRKELDAAIVILDSDGNADLAAELAAAARVALPKEAPPKAPAIKLDAEGFPADWKR